MLISLSSLGSLRLAAVLPDFACRSGFARVGCPELSVVTHSDTDTYIYGVPNGHSHSHTERFTHKHPDFRTYG